MDVVKNPDGTWKVWDSRSDPPSKLNETSDFCIGKGTFGCTTIQGKKRENTTTLPKEVA